jgi:hypothetical protein
MLKYMPCPLFIVVECFHILFIRYVLSAHLRFRLALLTMPAHPSSPPAELSSPLQDFQIELLLIGVELLV